MQTDPLQILAPSCRPAAKVVQAEVVKDGEEEDSEDIDEVLEKVRSFPPSLHSPPPFVSSLRAFSPTAISISAVSCFNLGHVQVWAGLKEDMKKSMSTEEAEMLQGIDYQELMESDKLLKRLVDTNVSVMKGGEFKGCV
jgi:hypothetical protein